MKNNEKHNVTKEELEQGLSGLEQRLNTRMDQKFVTKKELEQGLSGLEQRLNTRMDQKFVTKKELEQGLSGLEQRLEQRMDQKLAQTEARIVRWVVGLFLGSTVLMGTLIGTYALLVFTKV